MMGVDNMTSGSEANTAKSPDERREAGDIAAAVERVRRMEALFDRLSGALQHEPALLGSEEALRTAVRTLSAYQSGGDWQRDYELDEQGLLPADLKRGVLSQDGLYDLLCAPEIEAVLADGPDRGAEPVRIETVRTETFSMEYFRFGRGDKTLVILPGLSVQSVMGAADAIAAAYRPIEDAYTVYVFDRRSDVPSPYTVRDMARDTAEAFRALGLKDVCLFGASQGGMIALVLAIEYPELVGRMVLGSSSAHVQEAQYRVLEEWIRLAKAGDRVGLYLAFGREIYPPAVFDACRDSLIAAAGTVTDAELARFICLAEGTRGFDVVKDLDRIRCPVLAIGVYEDGVLDSDATMEIAEKLDVRPDFRLYLYTGYGHAAFDTAPDYKERLLRFFAS